MKSKQIHKQISLVQYKNYFLYSKANRHQSSYLIEQNSPNNTSSFHQTMSSYGTIKLEEVYIGLMIASNLFLTFVKSEEEELCRFKNSHVNFPKEKQIQIKKAVRIDNLVVLILREDIGNEIGYTSMTNIEKHLSNGIPVSYNHKDDDQSPFKFNYIDGRYYLNRIGNIDITKDILEKINNIYIKNINSFNITGISSSYEKKLKKLTNFNLPNFQSIHKEKCKKEDLKTGNHFVNLNEITLINCTIDSIYLNRNRTYFERTTIIYLDISWNQIGAEGIKQFSKMPLPNYLEYLNISGNFIGAVGMKELSKLKYLDICYNQIGPVGVKQLSKMLFPNLLYLNISFNQIEDFGMKYFSKMILPNLKYLYLRWNRIGSEGYKILSKMIILNKNH